MSRTWVLDGPWQFRHTSEDGWRSMSVPGCWEDAGIPKDLPGPFLYRRSVEVPREAAGSRLWLRFGAVSYACRVLVDDIEVGRHLGAWDPFEMEITQVASPGHEVTVTVEVEKPASLTAGPDSPAVPGRYPLRETLAGFLPYVWGHLFGGLWQPVSLVATGRSRIVDAWIAGHHDGRLSIEAELTGRSALRVTVTDPDGRVVGTVRSQEAASHRLEMQVPDPRPWSPIDPVLYQATVEVDGDVRSLRFGLRSVRADRTTILLNDRPVYPRLILSWGWYPDHLTPDPDPEQLRADLEQLRRLGFNGVKLCLWFPPEQYFDLADELGMLLWVELPMWLPRPTQAFVDQVGPEYERLVRIARRHPSVILYTLGCELNTDTAELLGPLFARVKALTGDALVRDNSGSGEAYGGSVDEHAEFHDHHFYADLEYLRGMLDHFAPAWRPAQPWLFGEFADSDAFRDPRTLAGPDGRLPWWASPDATVNPQGARWAMEVTELPAALGTSGYALQADYLQTLTNHAALLHRKYTLELVRSVPEVSGYVVTGERDTPISTAGVWDDAGRVRLAEDALRASNGDLAVLVGWERRRAWVAGGDRPARLDPWTRRSGDPVRAHLIASHFGRDSGVASVTWSVARLDAGGDPVASGSAEGPVIRPGEVREVAIARFMAPDVTTPTALHLHAAIEIGDERASNAWPLWVFPAPLWPHVARVGVIDPAGRLDDLAQLLGDRIDSVGNRDVAVATSWGEELERLVLAGARVVVLQTGRDGPLPAVPLPFWREAIRIAETHPAWADFPTEPFLGLQLFGVSADHALATTDAKGRMPIMTRLDARTGHVHDYAVELSMGTGRVIATSLRFDGSSGELPSGITRSAGALYLLGCWVRYLQRNA
jgi:hypothetical protein